MTLVQIDGVYECGYEYTALVNVPDPDPAIEIEDWWEEVVWEETGDNHTEKEGSCTTARVIACDDPRLVGAEHEWVD